MGCCNAAGDLMPPNVVYKAKNLYEGWTVGGPIGTGFGCTESGWFDIEQFERWCVNVFIRQVRHHVMSLLSSWMGLSVATPITNCFLWHTRFRA